MNTSIKQLLTERLNLEKEKLGITQAQMAELLGVCNRNYMNRILNGHDKGASIEKLEEFLLKLGVRVEGISFSKDSARTVCKTGK